MGKKAVVIVFSIIQGMLFIVLSLFIFLSSKFNFSIIPSVLCLLTVEIALLINFYNSIIRKKEVRNESDIVDIKLVVVVFIIMQCTILIILLSLIFVSIKFNISLIPSLYGLITSEVIAIVFLFNGIYKKL